MRCSFLNFCDLLLLTSGRRCFKLVFRGRIPPCPPVAGFVLFGPEFKSTKLSKSPSSCRISLSCCVYFLSTGCICPRYSQIPERKCLENWILMVSCRLPLSNSAPSKSWSFCLQDPEVDNFFRHCQKFDGTPSTDIEMVKLLKVRAV